MGMGRFKPFIENSPLKLKGFGLSLYPKNFS
jgi:hypothetical protein